MLHPRDLRGGSEVLGAERIPLSPPVSLGFILFQCGGHKIHGTQHDARAMILCNARLVQRECGDVSLSKLAKGF
jgi:hypothetical protein